MGGSAGPFEFEKTQLHHFIEIPLGSRARHTGQLLVFGIRNAEVRFEKPDGFDLPLIQIQSFHAIIGEPVAPNSDPETVLCRIELRVGKAGFPAPLDDVPGAVAELVDVAGQIEGSGEERIHRNREVLLNEVVDGEFVGKPTGIHDLHPVRKDVDLHGGIGIVVSVDDGIYDNLANRLFGDFEFLLGGRGPLSVPDGSV